MRDKQPWIDYCLTLPGAYEDYPFDDPDWTILRRQGNRKIFAMLFHLQGRLCLNLKCDPMQADFWRRVYQGRVVPGYHMNKVHWNTVYLDAGLEVETVHEMIAHPYELICPKRKTHIK